MNTNRFRFLTLATALCFARVTFPQGGVGINNPAPHASALLDLTSTNKGLLMPRMTTAQRTAIAAPATGLLVFDSSLNTFYYFDGTAWVPLASSGGWGLIGNAATSPLTNFIGTTDNIPLRFRVNNIPSGLLDPISDNAFFGYSAGAANSSGTSNTFVGSIAGLFNTTGQQNTFLGRGAGRANTTGSWNVFSGYGAGFLNTTGSQNTFIGQQAGASNTTAGFNTFLGGYAGNGTTTGEHNTFLGNNAGRQNILGGNNTFVGDAAGQNTGSPDNVFVGESSGAAMFFGAENTYVGAGSGSVGTSGTLNTLIGYRSGRSVTGGQNAMVGNKSGYSTTTGALNAFHGAFAGYWNTTGNFNTFIGNQSGFFNSTADDNTFIGFGSGYSNTTGTANTYLGSGAGGAATVTNATAIGSLAQVTASNSMALGGTGANAVKVGIGTTAPNAELEVNGFTMLGSTAPKIKMLYLTGTTAATQGTGVSTAHGIAGNKIISCTASVEFTSGNWVSPGYTAAAGEEFNVHWNTSTVTVWNVAGSSSQLLSKNFRICIIYIQ